TSMDERLVTEILLDRTHKNHPDVAVVITEVENLKRNLYLFTQIKDLGIPTVLLINMADRMSRKGITLDIGALEKKLDTKIVLVSTRRDQGMDRLKELLAGGTGQPAPAFLDMDRVFPDYFGALRKEFPGEDPYRLWLAASQDAPYPGVDPGKL